MRDLTEPGPELDAAAAAAIDAANAHDPSRVRVDGEERPLALVQGQRAADWVRRLAPQAGPAVVLAARAHHLRRWELARAAYPEGRVGYLRWRREQKQRHAAAVGEVLLGVGAGSALVERVQELVARGDLSDPDAQLVEDAACLVFVELQLAEFAARLDPAKAASVVAKTLAKMSPAAREAAQQAAPPEARPLLEPAG
ncbi:MAG: DUF4202 domain-containing protein [Acidimicrobiales bacterium]